MIRTPSFFPLTTVVSAFLLLPLMTSALALAQRPRPSPIPLPPPENAAQIEVEAKAALSQMVNLLEQGKVEEFIHLHYPIRNYLSIVARMQQGGQLPTITPREREVLIRTIEAFQQGPLTVHSSGRTVSFAEPVPADKKTRQKFPSLANPYENLPLPESSGYGADLSTVLRAAVADLKSGKAEAFARNLFPPSTIAMMNADGRWKDVVDKLKPGTDFQVRMLSDLQLIQTLKPVVEDRTATFYPERKVTINQPGNRSVEQIRGRREIRFSKIGDHWKFYDNTTQAIRQTNAAMQRPIPESIGPPPPKEELELQKIGSDWRLMTVPKI